MCAQGASWVQQPKQLVAELLEHTSACMRPRTGRAAFRRTYACQAYMWGLCAGRHLGEAAQQLVAQLLEAHARLHEAVHKQISSQEMRMIVLTLKKEGLTTGHW